MPHPDWLLDTPIAHRGLHDPDAGVPENSLAAFERAVDRGVPVEFDVHLSADGIPVVVHDTDLRRLTGRSGTVASLTVAELQTRRILRTGHRIPTLSEVLAVLDGEVGAMVEIKNHGRTAGSIERPTLDVLHRYHGPYCVASFNPRTVAWFKRHAPDVRRGQTAAGFGDVTDVPRWLRLVLRAMLGNPLTAPHFLSYDLRGLPHPAVDFWRRRADLPLITWTVRTPADLVKARAVADNFIFEGVVP